MTEPWVELLPYLPEPLREICAAALGPLQGVEEVRVRQGLPLSVVYGNRDGFVAASGALVSEPGAAYHPTASDLARALSLCSQNSLYAWEEELRNGFLTLPGGHRVGLAGRTVLHRGQVRMFKPVVGLNYRVSRQITGAADRVMGDLIEPAAARVRRTLIASAPQGGKTTLLRDAVRQISSGVARLRWKGVKVALVDERSEVAGSQAGVPRLDVGTRTDVIDGCPKALGMMLAIRSLSPQVVAVDEIGRTEDALAVEEAIHAGVSVLATAHGASLDELSRRPSLARLVSGGAFERLLILGRSRGPGTVEQVLDLTAASPLAGGQERAGNEGVWRRAVAAGSRGGGAGGGAQLP